MDRARQAIKAGETVGEKLIDMKPEPVYERGEERKLKKEKKKRQS